MLRISLIRNQTGPVFLRLEGDVTGPWVKELDRICDPMIATGERLRIDLAEVGFVDRAGLELLAQLQEHEATLEHCSAFLETQLRSTPPPALGHATALAAGG